MIFWIAVGLYVINAGLVMAIRQTTTPTVAARPPPPNSAGGAPLQWRVMLSGPRASGSLMSARDARGSHEQEKTRHWSGARTSIHSAS